MDVIDTKQNPGEKDIHQSENFKVGIERVHPGEEERHDNKGDNIIHRFHKIPEDIST